MSAYRASGVEVPDWLTLDNIYKAVALLSVIGSAVSVAIVSRLRAEFPSKADLTRVREQQEALGERTDAVEKELVEIRATLRSMPTQTDLNRITEQIGDLSGDVKALDATLDQGLALVREQLTMLMQHHIERGNS